MLIAMFKWKKYYDITIYIVLYVAKKTCFIKYKNVGRCRKPDTTIDCFLTGPCCTISALHNLSIWPVTTSPSSHIIDIFTTTTVANIRQ